jgi:hypothetical protein
MVVRSSGLAGRVDQAGRERTENEVVVCILDDCRRREKEFPHEAARAKHWQSALVALRKSADRAALGGLACHRIE